MPTQVADFAMGTSLPAETFYLEAISIAAVFFGALTYIGNGPNFMVKAIAESSGVQTPSFVAYIVKYSLPILVPIYVVVWFVFFSGYVIPHPTDVSHAAQAVVGGVRRPPPRAPIECGVQGAKDGIASNVLNSELPTLNSPDARPHPLSDDQIAAALADLDGWRAEADEDGTGSSATSPSPTSARPSPSSCASRSWPRRWTTTPRSRTSTTASRSAFRPTTPGNRVTETDLAFARRVNELAGD